MKASNDRLVWVDLEMTGLDVATNTILEMATIITDNDLEIIAEGPELIIHHKLADLEKMDEWNTKHHTESGLWTKALESKITLAEAVVLTKDFILEYCETGSSPLCGNSIGQDKLFLAKYMPEIIDILHYRVIDVSSFKEMINRWFPQEISQTNFIKKGQHRALEDIKESIHELKHYRRHFISHHIDC